MQLKNGNPVEKRTDLASLFCMIGRHGPAVAVAVIAMVSVVAGFIIYRTVRGKRREAAAGARDADGGGPGVPLQTPETAQGGVQSTNEVGEQSSKKTGQNKTSRKRRNRRTSAEQSAQTSCPPISEVDPEPASPARVEESGGNPKDVACKQKGDAGQHALMEEKPNTGDECNSSSFEPVLNNERPDKGQRLLKDEVVCDVLEDPPLEVKGDRHALTSPVCSEQKILVSNGVNDSQAVVTADLKESEEKPLSPPCDGCISGKEAEKNEAFQQDSDFSEGKNHFPEETVNDQSTEALFALQCKVVSAKESQSLQRCISLAETLNSIHDSSQRFVQANEGLSLGAAQCDQNLESRQDKSLNNQDGFEKESVEGAYEHHTLSNVSVEETLEDQNSSRDAELPSIKSDLRPEARDEMVPLLVEEPRPVGFELDAVLLQSKNVGSDLEAAPLTFCDSEVSKTISSATITTLKTHPDTSYEDKGEQMQGAEEISKEDPLLDVAEGLNPDLCPLQLLSCNKAEVIWTSIGEESGISSMTVSPDLLELECGITPDVLTSVGSDLEAQTDFPAVGGDVAEMVGAKEQILGTVASGSCATREMDTNAQGGEGAEQELHQTEINIMEATMDNNEWLNEGSYQVLPWMKSPVQAPPHDAQVATEETPSLAAPETTRSTPKDVNVTFRIHYLTDSPFQKVAITGDQHKLGNWKGFKCLEEAKDGHWATVLSLPVCCHVEWKFVVVDKGEVCRWEECGNRLLDVGNEDLFIHKWWGVV